MKQNRILLMIIALVVLSLACQALGGGDSESNPSPSNQPDQPGSSAPGAGGGEGKESKSGFVMTTDAYNEIDAGDGTLIFYTKMSGEAVMDFYRSVYTAQGYTEREILTVVTDGTFSMVFDGDPSGKALVIQSVDLGDGSRTVTMRLEDV